MKTDYTAPAVNITVMNPCQAFCLSGETTGVYIVPVIPNCGIKKLTIHDACYAVKCIRTFTLPTLLPGKIYNFGTIPVNAD